MKLKYVILMLALILITGFFEYFVLFSEFGLENRLNNAIQSAGVFVALIAAVIALSAMDTKPKKIKVSIESNIDVASESKYYKSELPVDLVSRYETCPDPIKTHKVMFKVVNNSGFTLQKPTLTFRLPLQKLHPHKSGQKFVLNFNSNLYNSQTELRVLEFADTRILSNSNLPYWNDKDEIPIWIRMFVYDGKMEPFNVEVSVNSDNAEGITKKVPIKPRDYFDKTV